MSYRSSVDLSPISGEFRLRPSFPGWLSWRVIRWDQGEDLRWRVAEISDHPAGDWAGALQVARGWLALWCDEVEAKRGRVTVVPVQIVRSEPRHDSASGPEPGR